MSERVTSSAFMMVPTDQFAELVEMVRELSEQRSPSLPSGFDLGAMGIEPLRVYSAKEVAHFLGTRREQSVYEIPEDLLPRAKSIGTKVGFLGINILCYVQELPPVDVAAAVEQYRQRLMQDRPHVRALNHKQSEIARVL